MNELWGEGKRKCFSCKEVKELIEFVSEPKKPKGRMYICKKCKSAKTYLKRVAKRTNFIKLRNNTCEKCGLYNQNPSFFDLDHIIPILDGRKARTFCTKDESNLQVLCPNCHRIKFLTNKEYLLKGQRALSKLLPEV